MECQHRAQYRYAVRVKDGAVTLRKLGMSRNRNVVATWCERCGAIEINGVSHFHWPRARVQEDS